MNAVVDGYKLLNVAMHALRKKPTKVMNQVTINANRRNYPTTALVNPALHGNAAFSIAARMPQQPIQPLTDDLAPFLLNSKLLFVSTPTFFLFFYQFLIYHLLKSFFCLFLTTPIFF